MNNIKFLKLYNSLSNNFAFVIATIGKRAIILLLIALTVILTSILLVDGWIRLFNHQTITILHNRIGLNNLYELKYNISQSENAERGFLITSRDNYLTLFNNAVDAARQNIAVVNLNLQIYPEKNKKAI